ncbi:pyrroline-5-carboxylate reductase [Ottowia thiooxydans]|uniref:pyrroline-5-carboxylate reductase n=1 Tax=Ottowia thiooxydans TaxID=219182 RepID=UPI000419CF49|nr:pyrroline-5-carboxylate reductase [Ottowia thiooxydans]
MTSIEPSRELIGFIGGGNMASAIIGGLIRQGVAPEHIRVVEPFESTRAALVALHGVQVEAAAGEFLRGTSLIVWAVKPQVFMEAAAPVRAVASNALHLSVMAGIRSGSIAAACGTQRIVRCMPNTPALIGRGMTALFAPAELDDKDRTRAEQVIRTTGDALWVEREEQLDAVTALSGSGPAYVFYFLEAMQEAGQKMGLSAAQARQLAVGTFDGASALAAASPDPLGVLRERVTSKGGTTYAALTSMEGSGVKEAFIRAMQAAQQRAVELGDEFGR